jgi:hypothetical protein
MAWNFCTRTVIMYCQRLDLVRYLEELMICKKPEITYYAGLCLDKLVE